MTLKFRVWSKQLKKWLTKDEWYFDFDGNIRFIDLSPESTASSYNPLINQDSFVIQQYTGLKDNNDKKIYEGDIVKVRISIETKSFHSSGIWRDISGTWCINPNPNHSNGRARALINFISDSGTYESQFADCKVIGNIFENPKLLK